MFYLWIVLYIFNLNNLNILDYKKSIDIDALNKDLVSQDYNLWDALESSKWLPLDTLEII